MSIISQMSQRIQSLETEIGRLKGKWEEAEKRVILSESQNYCKICGNTLDGYIPPREHEGDLE